jgi:hypothetical protein
MGQTLLHFYSGCVVSGEENRLGPANLSPNGGGSGHRQHTHEVPGTDSIHTMSKPRYLRDFRIRAIFKNLTNEDQSSYGDHRQAQLHQQIGFQNIEITYGKHRHKPLEP